VINEAHGFILLCALYVSAESFVVNFTLFIKTNLKTLSPEGYFATFEFPDKTGNDHIKLVNIVGARPQIIKASAISRQSDRTFPTGLKRLSFIPASITTRSFLKYSLRNWNCTNLTIT